MNKIKVRAHTCYLGKTGYNAHARGFFRELSKHVDLRVRNYTWDDNPTYLNEIDLGILDKITLSTGQHKYSDFWMDERPNFSSYKFTIPKTPFTPDVDIVLMDMNHHYFYEKFTSKIKIAYTVWESTRLPGYFVDKLVENFDYVWVVTEWHKKVLSEQGYPESRIHVVNEAVDKDFFPALFDNEFDDYKDNRFKFTIFGRWDFRKSVPEIIDAFLSEFRKDEPVDLILSVDNPFAVDGMRTTEERLEKYGFIDERLKVKHFVSREDYIKYIKNGHVLITCARSEGWNIPLIESFAAGVPSIYTNYGAQLEFAQGMGIPVDVVGLVPCLSGDTYNVQALAGTEVPGYYAKPDYVHLKKMLRYAYENYKELKKKALVDSEIIRSKFTWENAVSSAMNFFQEKLSVKTQPKFDNVCCVILSHADNKIKNLRLNDCVDSLNAAGYTTIVSSHIKEDCNYDYLIVSKENPIIAKGDFPSSSMPTFFVNSSIGEIESSFEKNHGFAVYMLIKSAVNFAYGKGYEKVHIINYDYLVKDHTILNDHEAQLENHDVVSYAWGNSSVICTGFFSANVKSIYKSLQKISTVEDFLSYGNVLEFCMHNLLSSCDSSVLLFKDIDHKKLFIDAESIPYYNTISLGSDFFDYAIIKDPRGGYILSLIRNENYPIEVRLIKEKLFYEIWVDKEDVHISISEDFLKEGFKIYLPSFEKYAEINAGTTLAKLNSFLNENLVLDINSFKKHSLSSKTRKINVNFIDGAFAEISDSISGKYRVQFIDVDQSRTVHQSDISENCWTKTGRKWYTKWNVRILDLINNEVIYNETLNLKDKRVFICFESSSLGDNIAWIPYVEEFRKKHGCHVMVSSFHNNMFKNEYPDLEFLERGVVAPNIHAMYKLGWFYEKDNPEYDALKAPYNFRDQPMQKTASDILGLPYTQIRPRITKPKTKPTIDGKYVCIGIHSTAQAKYWNNPTGWQTLVDYLNNIGYKVVLISKEKGTYMNNKPPVGIIDKSGDYPIEDRINDLQHCSFYIGLGSGLSWLAWGVGAKVVLISGFSKPLTEFEGNDVIRIFNPDVCNSCFNRYRLDAGDWNWCPDNKNTERQFECTKSIQPQDVIKEIQKFIV